MSRHRTLRILIPTVGLLVVTSQAPADPPRLPVPTGPPAAGDNPIPYGNTPDELRPFGSFVQQPYSRFFVDEVTYLGPGRSKPEPQVDRVKIGLLTPLDRTHESYIGREILQGTQLAIDEANAGGGYQGKPFELVVRNDSGLWGASANEVIRFAHDDQVRLILGTVDGANTHIAIRVALKLEIPVLSIGDLDPTLVETKIPWAFRVMPDDRQQAYTLAYYLYRQLGLKRVAVLRANNRYGRFGVGEFIASSTRLKRPAPMEVNYELSWAETNPDFTMQLERLKKVNPEALVLWADPKAAGRIVDRLRAAGMTFPVYACDRIIHPDFFAAAGPAAEGVVAVTTFLPDEDDPEYQGFLARYRARFGKEPTAYASYAYDGTMLGIGAIRKAGLNWAKIRDALAEAIQKPHRGVTGQVSFDYDLSNRRRVALATARSGRFVPGEPKAEVSF